MALSFSTADRIAEGFRYIARDMSAEMRRVAFLRDIPQTEPIIISVKIISMFPAVIIMKPGIRFTNRLDLFVKFVEHVLGNIHVSISPWHTLLI